jgi:hypothetical protein
MPRGPRGEKRPADVIGTAITVARISVGDVEEKLTPPSGRVRSGRAGEKMSAEDRAVVARKATNARWA